MLRNVTGAVILAYMTSQQISYPGRALGVCPACKTVVRVDSPLYNLGGTSTTTCRCGNRVTVKAVIGTLAPHVKCDARCLNAKRAQCDCSCSGANHGAGH